MDPLGAGLMVGGNVLGTLLQDDPEKPQMPRSYTGLLNPAQITGTNQLLQMLMSGGGDFGSGAATRQANATLMGQLANRGIDPNSKFAGSALADMLGGIAGQDASRRGNLLLQVLNSTPGNRINYQNLGYGFEGTPFGQAAANMDKVRRDLAPLAAWGPARDAVRDIENQIAAGQRTGGSY